MKFFTTALNPSDSFSLINLEQVTKVDFQTVPGHPKQLVGCFIHFTGGGHHQITNQNDLQHLLLLLQQTDPHITELD